MTGPASFDLIVVGAGPAGSCCAAHCARVGLRTLLLEKARFPREKVCGDCLNPSAWPVLERLGVADGVRALPHAPLDFVELIDLRERRITVPLPDGESREIAVKRRHLDQLLLEHAAACGAQVLDGTPVTAISPGWQVRTPDAMFTAPFLVAADGRNSTVARILGLLPPAARDRLAIQAHAPLPSGCERRVALQLRPEGYCGFSDVGDGQLNVCLVSTAVKMERLKAWAQRTFDIAPRHPWRSIAPLARGPVMPELPNLLLVGDAARVVEPFTGEGIYYALSGGELAAARIASAFKNSTDVDLAAWHAEQAAPYRGRLWVNRLARTAVLHPRAGHRMLAVLRIYPPLLGLLTGKIVSPAG